MHRFWIRWVPWMAPETSPRAALPPAPGVDDELPVEPEKPWGCGWFDSSLDLREGLAVIEHAGLPLELAVLALVAPQTPAAPARRS